MTQVAIKLLVEQVRENPQYDDCRDVLGIVGYPRWMHNAVHLGLRTPERRNPPNLYSNAFLASMLGEHPYRRLGDAGVSVSSERPRLGDIRRGERAKLTPDGS